MSRSARRLAPVLGLLAAAAVITSACGAASAPALTDPKEIVLAAVRAGQAAKSVHIDAKLDGSITADLTGAGSGGTPIALTGTTAAADVDIAGGSAHATFTVPTLFGLTGELIQIGGMSYLKTSLTPGGKFTVENVANSLPVNPTNPTSLLDSVGELLSKPGVDPVKGEDVACGSTQCYTVKIDLTPAELNALDAGGPVPSGLPIDLGTANLSLTIRVEKNTSRLAGVAATVAMGKQGSLTIDLSLSRWDEPVAISAPPADQLQTAP